MRASNGLGMIAGCSTLILVLAAAAPAPTVLYGALAVDDAAGDQWGWAVDYPTQAEADLRARLECGDDCSVVLRFTECGAYAGAGDGARGWAYGSDLGYVRTRALNECSRRTSEYCVIRAYGCNSRG
ncbi:MAG TPA: DUF4189 domain-containing protein [Longimicrobiales bacterium]|nr:DUF4189 domain-containing protein [Longimicrobiales bacterium]